MRIPGGGGGMHSETRGQSKPWHHHSSPVSPLPPQHLLALPVEWNNTRPIYSMGLFCPIFHSSCEGELGVALESLQGKRNLIQACV